MLNQWLTIRPVRLVIWVIDLLYYSDCYKIAKKYDVKFSIKILKIDKIIIGYNLKILMQHTKIHQILGKRVGPFGFLFRSKFESSTYNRLLQKVCLFLF